MIYALPVIQGQVSSHFGHADQFAIIRAGKNGEIIESKLVNAPEGEHSAIAGWLSAQGVTKIIAGGIGQRAQMMMSEKGIKVFSGATEVDPGKAVASHLEGTLATNDNICSNHTCGNGDCHH